MSEKINDYRLRLTDVQQTLNPHEIVALLEDLEKDGLSVCDIGWSHDEVSRLIRASEIAYVKGLITKLREGNREAGFCLLGTLILLVGECRLADLGTSSEELYRLYFHVGLDVREGVFEGVE